MCIAGYRLFSTASLGGRALDDLAAESTLALSQCQLEASNLMSGRLMPTGTARKAAVAHKEQHGRPDHPTGQQHPKSKRRQPTAHHTRHVYTASLGPRAALHPTSRGTQVQQQGRDAAGSPDAARLNSQAEVARAGAGFERLYQPLLAVRRILPAPGSQE